MTEHVSNVNPSMKDVYRCSNSNCSSHKIDGHWNERGEFYRKSSDVIEVFKPLFINNNDAPFNTLCGKINS